MNENFIINNQNDYLNCQSKTLEERIKEVCLTNEDEITVDKTVETIAKEVLETSKIGKIASVILNWNDEINEEIEKAKKQMLLEVYLNKSDNYEQQIKKIENLLATPQGINLFNKIIVILQENPPDKKLIEYLANTLNHIIDDGDIYKLFEKHKFIIEQIALLSTQAIGIMIDCLNPIIFKNNAPMKYGPKLTYEWEKEVTEAYCIKSRIIFPEMKERVYHVIAQLKRQNLIEAYELDNRNKKSQCILSKIGNEIAKYVSEK